MRRLGEEEADDDVRRRRHPTSVVAIPDGRILYGSDGPRRRCPDSPVQDRVGCVLAGTVITSGLGVAVVIRTSMDTEMGKIQTGVTEARVGGSGSKRDRMSSGIS